MKRILLLLMMTSLMLVTACKKEDQVKPETVPVTRNLTLRIDPPTSYHTTMYMRMVVWIERNGAQVDTVIQDSWYNSNQVSVNIDNPPFKVYYSIEHPHNPMPGWTYGGTATFYVDNNMVAQQNYPGVSWFYVQ